VLGENDRCGSVNWWSTDETTYLICWENKTILNFTQPECQFRVVYTIVFVMWHMNLGLSFYFAFEKEKTKNTCLESNTTFQSKIVHSFL